MLIRGGGQGKGREREPITNAPARSFLTPSSGGLMWDTMIQIVGSLVMGSFAFALFLATTFLGRGS